MAQLVNVWRSSAFGVAMVLAAAQASAMKVDVFVDKVSQHMHVSVDGSETYDWLVSTGGEGHDTPSGSYHIFRMEKSHFSQEWDNAPMPNSMFFTPQGHAIHGSSHISRLGTRASHGCVRLAPENAAILYDLVEEAGYKNSSVVIKGGLFDGGPAFADGAPRRPLFWFLRPLTRVADDVVIKSQPVAKPVTDKKKKKSKPLSFLARLPG